ncbi:bifunctional lytic transglycosylase/C40 family peptidase [Streptomyces sp. NPDC048629]|uniref:C40 family peptidase n=1 Tax=Streptomyces sp. NPDC048629 TaxID=3154824 RepID=UPI00341C1767
MGLKRLLALTGVGLAMTPAALSLGVVITISAFGDDEFDAVSPVGGGLKIGGKDGVPPRYVQLILDAAAACDQGLSPQVLAAQLKQESGFNPHVRSPANAMGIAQFVPGTWATEGVDGNGDGKKDVWDPEDAIPSQGSMMCKLLRTAKKHPDYKGSPIELALAGYNAGWGNVSKFRAVPPPWWPRDDPGQTYYYVRNILAMSVKLTAEAPTGDVNLPAGYELPANTPDAIKTAVAWALRAKGGWYQFGGDCTIPHGDVRKHRCDCSSLMQQSYKAAGIGLPRTTYDQVNEGRQVSIDAPKPGDLVFNPGSDGSDARPGHVGMYIGDGMLIEAPRTGVQTRIVSYRSWRNSTSAATRITEVRRIVDW